MTAAVTTTMEVLPTTSMEFLSRKERFCSIEKPIPAAGRSFENGSIGSGFIDEWRENNQQLVNSYDGHIRICRQAREGILEEGRRLQQEQKAQQLASKLEISERCGDYKNICACVARLYTEDSFLYKLVNETLRNDDRRKVKTLGPYCWLLFCHLYIHGESEEELIVYRGCRLSDEMINEYKQFEGKWIKWLSFVSTSKNPRVAEAFSGDATIFIIHLEKGSMLSRDITKYSAHPDEEEVLLNAGHTFKVKKVERDLICLEAW